MTIEVGDRVTARTRGASYHRSARMYTDGGLRSGKVVRIVTDELRYCRDHRSGDCLQSLVGEVIFIESPEGKRAGFAHTDAVVKHQLRQLRTVD